MMFEKWPNFLIFFLLTTKNFPTKLLGREAKGSSCKLDVKFLHSSIPAFALYARPSTPFLIQFAQNRNSSCGAMFHGRSAVLTLVAVATVALVAGSGIDIGGFDHATLDEIFGPYGEFGVGDVNVGGIGGGHECLPEMESCVLCLALQYPFDKKGDLIDCDEMCDSVRAAGTFSSLVGAAAAGENDCFYQVENCNGSFVFSDRHFRLSDLECGVKQTFS
jgi:hypothetical protein